MSGRSAVVALTDRRWFDFLRSRAIDGRLDEVNFWRPKAQTEFRSLQPGEPFFFRLKSPVNAIAGYGFFSDTTGIVCLILRDVRFLPEAEWHDWQRDREWRRNIVLEGLRQVPHLSPALLIIITK